MGKIRKIDPGLWIDGRRIACIVHFRTADAGE